MSLVYCRSTIVLDDRLQATLDTLALRQGADFDGRVVLAARTMTLNNDRAFVPRRGAAALPYELVLLADRFEAPRPHGGDPAVVDASGVPGADRAGRDAASLSCFARTSAGLFALRAVGADGAGGAAGHVIGNVEFDPDAKPPQHFEWDILDTPTDGEDGGNGGSLRAFVALGDMPALDAHGGSGGFGGTVSYSPTKAPAGMRSGPRPAVAPGRDGSPGDVGAIDARRLDAAQFWPTARAYLRADEAASVAGFFLDLARYDFRTMGGARHDDDVSRIVAALDAAEGLRPGDGPTRALREQFFSDFTAIGLPRRLDVVADFPRFHQAYLDDWLILKDGFDNLRDVLAAGQVSQVALAEIGSQQRALEGEVGVLGDERTLARERADLQQTLARHAGAAMAATQNRIQARLAAIDAAKHDMVIEGVVVGVLAVVGFIATVVSGGSGAAVVVPALVKAVPGVVTLVGAAIAGVGGGEDLLRTGLTLEGSKGLAEIAKGLDADTIKALVSSNGQLDVGALAKLMSRTNLVVSLRGIVDDLERAQGDDQLRQLVSTLAQQTFDKLVADAEAAIALGSVKVAELRFAHAQAALSDLQALSSTLSAGSSLTRLAALTLLSQFQIASDRVLAHKLAAARAVEVFTLSDQSASLRMSHGFLPPDVMADFEADLISDEVFVAHLVLADTDPDIIALGKAYADVAGALRTATVELASADPADLAALRAGDLSLRLTLDRIAAEPVDIVGEAKVVGVRLALTGVTATQAGSVSVDVSQGAMSAQRLPDGSVQTLALPTEFASLTLARDSAQPALWQSEVPAESGFGMQPFFGRGAAATYGVRFDPDRLAALGIDFSGVTRVSLTVHLLALQEAFHVTYARRNREGQLLAVGGTMAGAMPWEAPAEDVIAQLRSGRHSFFVQSAAGVRAPVRVHVSAHGRPYLATVRDGIRDNNLDALPVRSGPVVNNLSPFARSAPEDVVRIEEGVPA